MIEEKLKKLGYNFTPAPIKTLTFHSAVRAGNLVFTSGQIPLMDNVQIKGKVGRDIGLQEAQRAAEICAFNCVRAAGALVPINKITRVVKILGIVNVAEGFDQTSEVINGASDFYNNIFGDLGLHARSAIGAVLPSNWSVELEAIFEVESD